MDEIDVAQQNDELFRRAALRAHFAGRQNALMTRTGKAGPSSDGRGTLPYHTQCRDCGERIETARLKALPYADRCVGCQTKREREGQNG